VEKFQTYLIINKIICKNDYVIISFDDESCVEGAKMFDETPFSEDDETVIKVDDFIEEFDFQNLVTLFNLRKINLKVIL